MGGYFRCETHIRAAGGKDRGMKRDNKSSALGDIHLLIVFLGGSKAPNWEAGGTV